MRGWCGGLARKLAVCERDELEGLGLVTRFNVLRKAT